jgi:hypothetical protein
MALAAITGWFFFLAGTSVKFFEGFDLLEGDASAGASVGFFEAPDLPKGDAEDLLLSVSLWFF